MLCIYKLLTTLITNTIDRWGVLAYSSITFMVQINNENNGLNELFEIHSFYSNKETAGNFYKGYHSAVESDKN